MVSKRHKKEFENIYDMICDTMFKEEASREFSKFIKDKEANWNGDNNTISIGKRFRIALISK